MTPSPTPGLTRFNTADQATAEAALREICTSERWIGALLTRRPYPDTKQLLAASDAATAELAAQDVSEAMAGHPPIGRPTPGDPTSAREQHGMADAPGRLRDEVLQLNQAYRQKFGHVFLICATGLTGEQMRDAVRDRIDNTPEREEENVRIELAKINRIRLVRLVEGGTL